MVLAEERKLLLNLGPQGLVEPVPDHLAGVPSCLHKYEPLLKQAWEARQAVAEEPRRAASTG